MSRSMKILAVAALVLALGAGALAGALLTGATQAAAPTAPVAALLPPAHPGLVVQQAPNGSTPGQPAPGQGHRRGAGARYARMGWAAGGPAVVAKELGMTVQELVQARQSGQSIAQIAQSKGVSLDTLINAVLAAPKAALDVRVQQGVLTAQQEQQILSQLQKRLEANFTRTGTGRPNSSGSLPAPQSTAPQSSN
ncbi:MAG: hypothetical protein QJR08_06125 [Bacillota bacterium]|nr:hypothetical protein [Bacillota bacterium]